MSNGTPGYHEGMTDAQIKTLFIDIGEIKSEMKALRSQVDGLNTYKAKVTGLALGVSSATSMLIRLLWH